MFLFLITCSFSLILYKSLTLKPLPSWACEMRFIFFWFWKGLSFFLDSFLVGVNVSYFSSKMSNKKNFIPNVDSVDVIQEMSILDLPDLLLESILEKLPPNELCKVANVCSVLRDKCLSDHIWEMHMKNKWGRVIGPAAYKERRLQIASKKCSIFSSHAKNKGQMGHCNLVDLWSLELIRSSFSNIFKKNNFPPAESAMSCYLAIELGKFWFPAQVYNRENGHAGFMLSCYDAMLSYDRRTNTFQARYPEHGTRPTTVETGVTLDRLRAKPVDTSPHHLHISNCLDELKPGDHIEIQWRRNREFPYGWWYGVIGHLETCDENADYCRCHDSVTLVLEFNQYGRGSRWRWTLVDRKGHRETGNDVDGYYGGIRKLCEDEEIRKWRKLWPPQVFE